VVVSGSGLVTLLLLVGRQNHEEPLELLRRVVCYQADDPWFSCSPEDVSCRRTAHDCCLVLDIYIHSYTHTHRYICIYSYILIPAVPGGIFGFEF
jgi:hypothetical protein